MLTTAQRHRSPPAQKSIRTDRGAISYRCAGRGAPVVLLHGIGSNAHTWAGVQKHLAARYRACAWDAPGYGASDALPAPARDGDGYADALAAFLKALKIKRCVLVAHSLGALIAGRYAARWPERVRGLVLADPARGHGHLPAAERETSYRERIDALARLGAAEYAAARAPRLLSRNATAEQLADARAGLGKLRSEGYEAAARLLRDGDLVADSVRITCPVCVLWGAEDAITTPAACREVAAAFPGGASCVELERTGHASHIERPAEFAAAVDRFIGSLP